MHRFLPAIASEMGVTSVEKAVNHSPRRHGLAMAPSLRNTESSTRQLRSIGRRCGLIVDLSMLISISRARFLKKATCRKQSSIIRRRRSSTQSSPSLITILEKFSCAKATFPAQSRNSKKRYVSIPTFRKPRKTCTRPRQATRTFLPNRPGKILSGRTTSVHA